ncbi:MAG: hypothetical protein WC828_06995 [Thermoleophilia bacterium]
MVAVEVVVVAAVLVVDTVGLEVVVTVTVGFSLEHPRPSTKASKTTPTTASPEITPIKIFLFFDDMVLSF